MSFQLVPNSVTSDDLQRRNSANCCVISQNSVAFRTDHVKMVRDTLILSAAEMLGQRIKFIVIYHLRRYL